MADTLGVPLTDIAVLHSDTDKVAQGNGTMGSRSLVVGGSAVMQAAQKVSDQALRLAAHMLRLAPDRVTLMAGTFRCIDDPAITVSFADVANRSFAGPVDLPPGMEFLPGGHGHFRSVQLRQLLRHPYLCRGSRGRYRPSPTAALYRCR